MSHLTMETLARLVDETTTAEEAAHLAACEECRSELELMRADVRALATLPDMTPAPDAWDALELRLAAEGIVRTRRTVTFPSRTLLQAAAAAVLFIGGVSVGRIIAAPDATIAQAPQPEAPGVEGVVPPAPDVATVADPIDSAPAAAVTNPNVTLASTGSPMRYTSARTLDEAGAVLRQTEELYLSALTRYAELATEAESGDPIARLAALQSIVMTTQAALSQTPADPVINGYHLTALAQRDATLRQVAAATSDRWY